MNPLQLDYNDENFYSKLAAYIINRATVDIEFPFDSRISIGDCIPTLDLVFKIGVLRKEGPPIYHEFNNYIDLSMLFQRAYYDEMSADFYDEDEDEDDDFEFGGGVNLFDSNKPINLTKAVNEEISKCKKDLDGFMGQLGLRLQVKYNFKDDKNKE